MQLDTTHITPEGTPILGQYGYVPPKAPPPPPTHPIFVLALAAPKDSTFRPVQLEKNLLFKKVYVSLLFLAPKPPF